MSAEQTNLWDGLVQMGKELKRTHSAGFLSAALTFAYVCIDTMSYLSLPEEKSQRDRSDVMAWGDTYLKADPARPYQYRGLDVYAARCAVLRAFTAEAELHRKDPGVRAFGYQDGVDQMSHPHLVLIGIASCVNDMVGAIEPFLAACQDDADLRAHAEPTSREGPAYLPDPGPMIAAMSPRLRTDQHVADEDQGGGHQ